MKAKELSHEHIGQQITFDWTFPGNGVSGILSGILTKIVVSKTTVDVDVRGAYSSGAALQCAFPIEKELMLSEGVSV